MLTLVLLACAPWTTLSPPDPFAAPQTRTVGVGVFGGAQLPEEGGALSPGAYLNLRPLPKLELGMGAFVRSDGTDWPRQVVGGGAGLSLRYYALQREDLALGPTLELTFGSVGLGLTGAKRLGEDWTVHAGISAGEDFGSVGGGAHPLACGALVRAPLGVGHARGSWRFGAELSAAWSPLVTTGLADCGYSADAVVLWFDAPAPLVLVGGLRVGRVWPPRAP